MENLVFYGILEIEEQKYALPLNDILGIENTASFKSVDGKECIIYQNKEINLYNIISIQHDNQLVRKLGVVINGDETRAIQVDSFVTQQVKSASIKRLPHPMIENKSIIKNVISDEENKEIILMLDCHLLNEYLDR